VVVNYCSGEDLAECVTSLRADTSAGGEPEVVVVDNGSDDGSVRALVARHADVPVLGSGRNLGYGRAANLGTAATRGAVVAVLNPDTRVVPGAAGALVPRLAGSPDLGALGPRLENPDGSRYPSARIDPGLLVAIGHAILGRALPGNPMSRAYRHADLDDDELQPAGLEVSGGGGRPGEIDVDWVSGAAVWMRRDALDAVGGWDERFFLFFEDVDLCRRLREHGFRIAYVPEACVRHTVGASRARHPYRAIVAHHRAAYRYAAKWWRGPRRLLLPAAAAFLGARAAASMAAAAARGGPDRHEAAG
jgi:N-acetylglucosaminyl-diphospho-decaprenol L-rhamnosyltransferase